MAFSRFAEVSEKRPMQSLATLEHFVECVAIRTRYIYVYIYRFLTVAQVSPYLFFWETNHLAHVRFGVIIYYYRTIGRYLTILDSKCQISAFFVYILF